MTTETVDARVIADRGRRGGVPGVPRPATTLDVLRDHLEVITSGHEWARQLRHLIRNLAVTGRLLPQVSSDEDARMLLARITGREVEPNADDAPRELPSTWVWCRFTDVATIESHLVSPAGFLDLPHVAPDNIEKGTGRLLDCRTVREDGVISSKHRFFPGQIVYSKIRPNLSKAVQVDFEGLCSADMYPLRPAIHGPYLHLFLLSSLFLEQVVRDDNRLAMPKVNQEQLSKTIVAVPPLAEQKRIVAKVDQLMALCDDLEARQTKKRETSTRLTKSALQALTTAEGPEEFDIAWKRVVDNFDVLIDRSAKVADLRRIILELAIRGRLVVPRGDVGELEEQVATERANLASDRRGGGRGRAEAQDPAGLPAPHPIPAGWRWKALADVAGHIVDGTHHTPRYVQRGKDFISAKDIRNGRITFDGCKQISPEEFDELTRRCAPKRGDVLVTKSGSIGEVAVVETDRPFTLFESVALVPVVSALNTRFAAYVVYLGASGQFGAENRRGVAVKHLHLVDLRRLPFPLPPRAEQDEIVAKVEQLMKVCDELEARLTRAEDRAAKLVEAVVRDLVP